MKRSKLFAVATAAGLIGMIVTTATLLVTRPETRSAGPVNLLSSVEPKFSRAESTGLFVGVREFPHDPTLTVPFAVDDAVDLAHRFVFDQRIALIPPRRVMLALSGKPQKEESRERLRQLTAAGAIVQKATSGDIRQLVEHQAEKAGANGLFVVSVATHGFLQDGDAYVLGSSSAFGSPETSLRTATLFDLAGRAGRSLVFVDACRDRIGQTSRGAAADPTAAAPLIRRMANVTGQVVLYAAAAGQYAYDDDVQRNGVFTKAVLDGLNCDASAPRGMVNVETLHRFVERQVRAWIRLNRNKAVRLATQVSMEGDARTMPLVQCWRSPEPPIRVSFDGSTVSAYDAETRRLLRKNLGGEILLAQAADLDADGLHEVVVGMRDRITALDRDGVQLWSFPAGAMSLRTLAIGDLFEKHTNQIVAIWSDDRTSRLSIIGSDGKEKSSLLYEGLLQRVAVGRTTNMHNPKIALTGVDNSGSPQRSLASIFVVDPKKLASKLPLWRQILLSRSDEIRDLRIIDADNDSRRDIVVTTKRGRTLFTFDGKIIRAADEWKDVSHRKRRSASKR